MSIPLPIRLREATLDDARDMADVACRAWRFAYSSFLPSEFIEEIAEPKEFTQLVKLGMERPGFRLVALSSENKVIGFASERRPCKLEDFDAEIGGFYVDPDHSRSGVGQALLRAMVDQFLTDGHRSMAIYTLSENEIGCRFYEKHGGLPGPHETWNAFPSKWYLWPNLAELKQEPRE